MFCLFNKSVFIIIYFICCFITTSVLAVEWVQLGGDIDGEAPGDQSGISVSLSADGTRVAIGAFNNDDGGSDAGHVRVYDYDSSSWIQVGADIDGEAAGDKSGWTTSLSDDGTRLAIGAYLNNGIGTNSGHTRIYEYDSSTWVQLGGDIDAESVGDQSGFAVFMSGDGTRVAIGAIGNDDAGSDAGHARVYEYNSTNWVQVGGDMDGEAAVDFYGNAVSLSKDGTRVAIGSFRNSDGGFFAGHVRVFEYDSSTWVQLGVDIYGEDAYDHSGASVSLSSDGSRVAIGAKNNFGGGAYSGHVRVFEYNSSAWLQLGNDIDGEATTDQSGYEGSVSISSNGTRVAIGAYLNDGGAENGGHVRVYDFNTLTSSWDLVGQDIDGDEIGGGSGRSVSLSSAGVIVAVGAYGVNSDTGQVRVWKLVDSPTGLPSAQPTSPTGQPTYGIRDWIRVGGDIDGEASGDGSGRFVSLSANGTRVAIGAANNDDGGSDAGHVRVYDYDSSAWIQVGEDIDGEAAGDKSGWATSLSDDGTRLAIGAYLNDGIGTNSGHTRIYEYDSSTWVQLGGDIDGESVDDQGGIAVFMSGDGTRVAIGAIGNDNGGSDAGHVRVFEYNSSTWVQIGGGIDGVAANDKSGISVSLSSDGGRIAVGASQNDGGGANAGHVRVYDYDSSAWVQAGGDIDGETIDDHSGTTVSLSSDGTRVAIGAKFNDDGGSNAGHVRVFEYVSTTWVQLGGDIDGEAAFDHSGYYASVSLSGDGTRVAVGAYLNDGGGSNAGHVRVYDYDFLSTSWCQIGVDIDGDTVNGYSGRSVSLSSDGSRVAIGAVGVNSSTGQVRIWQLAYAPTGQPTGQPTFGVRNWFQIGSDLDGEAEEDWSGWSVSLSSDGDRVAIGASLNDGAGSGSGHVRVYEYATSAWVQLGPDIDGEAAGDQSGYSVSLTADGNRVAIGGFANDGTATNAGQVRVYDFNASSWIQVGGDIDGEASFDYLGCSVSLSANGTRLAAGGYLNDEAGTDAGHVRVYEYDSSTWVQVGSDIDGEAAGDFFGWSVSLSADGSRVAVGAYYNDGGGGNAGHSRVFEYDSTTWNQLGSDIDGSTGDFLGHSVSLSNDGKCVTVGAYGGSYAAIYEFISSAWVQKGSDIVGENPGDYAGWSVSLSSDGTRVAVGGPRNDGGGTDAGHVRIFDYDFLASQWIQIGIDIDGDEAQGWSGDAVSLSSDGSRVAIGARKVDNERGQVRIWQLAYVPTGEPSGEPSTQPTGQPSYGVREWIQVGGDIDGEASGDQSGRIVSLSRDGNIVAIAARYNDDGGDAAGHVRVYEYDTTTWIQLGGDIDGENAGDESGVYISLSGNGTRLAVGAFQNDGGGTNAGHVRVYEYDSFNWVQLGGDIDGEAAGDESGFSVALTSDGTRVAIGTRYNDDGGSDAGHVRVFDYNSSAWVQLGGDIDGAATDDNCGYAVSLSNDVARVATGCPGRGSGRVQILEFDSSTWVQVGEDIDGASVGDLSGASVSLSSDGTRVAIGSPNNDDGGTDAGHVRIFEYDSSSWVQLGGDIVGEAAGDLSSWYGSLSLSSDGGRVAVGGFLNDGFGSDAGHVRVFEYDVLASAWSQLGGDINGDAVSGFSGRGVSLSSDGSKVAIGSYGVNGQAGQVRIWQLAYVPTGEPSSEPSCIPTSQPSGEPSTQPTGQPTYGLREWIQVGGSIDGDTSGDQSGRIVSLSRDGNIVAIAARYNDDGGDDAGHVRVYEYDTTTWIQLGGDIDGENAGDESGVYISLSGNGTRLAVGAFQNDGGGTNAGHVRVYEYDSFNWVQLGGDIDGEAAGDESGFSVTLTSDGTRVAIGTRYNDDGGSDAGHVRVFDYNSSAWVQLGGDIDGAATDDNCGYAVSLSNDVARVATGCPGRGSGRVQILEFDSSTWVQVGEDIDGASVGDLSGASVSLSSDGTRVAIGSPNNDDGGTDAGHVRIFEYDSSSWVQLGGDIVGEAAGDLSSWYGSLSLSSDGGHVAVGGSLNDGFGSDAGHVRVFEYDVLASAWSQLGGDINGDAVSGFSGRGVSLSSDGSKVAIGSYGVNGQAGQVRIWQLAYAPTGQPTGQPTFGVRNWFQIGSDLDGEAEEDWSGWSVSLSSDGDRVAIGASLNDGAGSGSGHVRVYEYVTSAWVQLGPDIDGEAAGDQSGYSVSLTADGNRVAIGGFANDGTATNAGQVRVYDFNASSWIQVGGDIDGEASFDYLGCSVSLSANGTRLAAGGYLNDGTGTDAGHVRVYEYDSSTWVQVGSDIDGEAAGDFFGWSVSLSADGSRVAVGAYYNDGGGGNAGHSRVFEYDSTTWNQLGSDIDGSTGDFLGHSVSLSNDGNCVAVGAYGGSYAAIYEFISSAWVQKGSDIVGENPGDYAGWSVSLSSDGTRVAVGGPRNDGGGTDAGHVRIFDYDFLASQWIQIGIDIDGDEAQGWSGDAVSLSSDGSRVAIGARKVDNERGQVRIWQLAYVPTGEPSGEPSTQPTGQPSYGVREWIQVGGDIDGEAEGDRSGIFVSLSGDGTRVAVGAYFNDDGGSNSGHVRIYEYDSSSWNQVGTDIDGEAADDNSGYSVSLSLNGTVVAIGAKGNDGGGSGAGHVRVYEYDSSTWIQVGADIEGEAAGDQSGNSVSLSSDGSRLAVGATHNDDGGTAAGHVRVYEYNTSTWVQVGVDIDGEADDDRTGIFVSMSSEGTIVAIGAHRHDGVGSDSGYVRVYEYDSSTWVQLGGDIEGEAADDFSGVVVSLCAGGTRVAIGAYANDGGGTDSGHVRVFEYDSFAWIQLGNDIDGEAAGDKSGFYGSVSLSSSGSRVAVGSYLNDDGGTYAGHVRVFDYDLLSSSWALVGEKIIGDVVNGFSGRAVSLSSDGNKVAVGAYGVNSDTGQVRVWQLAYVPTEEPSMQPSAEPTGQPSSQPLSQPSAGPSVQPSTEPSSQPSTMPSGEPSAQPTGQPTYGLREWIQVGGDIDGEASGDGSGIFVSLSGDGTRVAVGADRNDDGGLNSGHVRIYEYDSSSWNQVGTDIDGEAAHDGSGLSVSLSLNGTVVAIGALGNDGGGSGAGHVRVYEYDSSTWIQVGADIEGEAAGDQSGYSVSLSSDGSRLAVGATHNDDGGTAAGHVRVYEYDTSTWVQVGVDIDGEADDDRTGIFVSMSSEGTIVAIGAYRHDGVGSDSGYVRVYEYDSSTWVQLGGDIEGEATNDQSGVAVSLCAGGTRVAIGAKTNDGGGTDSGHVRVFEYDSSAWTQLGNDIDGEAAGDQSGFDGSVSLSSSGSRVAVGSHFNDDGGTNAGHVRVFDYDHLSSSWSLVGEKIIGDVVNGFSGRAVSLSSDGNKVAIGAHGVNSDTGQVRVWQLAYVPTGEPSMQPSAEPTGQPSSQPSAMPNREPSTQPSAEPSGQPSSQPLSQPSAGPSVQPSTEPSSQPSTMPSGEPSAQPTGQPTYGLREWIQVGGDIDGEASGDGSGIFVSLSGDGTRVAVGADRNDDGGLNSGHVRIYEYDSSSWNQVGTDIDGEAAHDGSGLSVSLSLNGTVVAIGALGNDGGGLVRVTFEYMNTIRRPGFRLVLT